MDEKIEGLVNDCADLCLRYRCSIEAALDDLSWPTNGLGITEEQEFLVRYYVKIELRKRRKWDRWL